MSTCHYMPVPPKQHFYLVRSPAAVPDDYKITWHVMIYNDGTAIFRKVVTGKSKDKIINYTSETANFATIEQAREFYRGLLEDGYRRLGDDIKLP